MAMSTRLQEMNRLIVRLTAPHLTSPSAQLPPRQRSTLVHRRLRKGSRDPGRRMVLNRPGPRRTPARIAVHELGTGSTHARSGESTPAPRDPPGHPGDPGPDLAVLADERHREEHAPRSSAVRLLPPVDGDARDAGGARRDRPPALVDDAPPRGAERGPV